MARFNIGDLVTFSYPQPPNTKATDPYPAVLVLHPNFLDTTRSAYPLMHGVNFNNLTDDEINTVRMLLDPFYEMKYREGLKRKNFSAYQELEKIITTGGEFKGIKVRNVPMISPQMFYYSVMQPFLYKGGTRRSAYRLYRVDKISGGRIVTPARVMLGEESLAKWKGEKDELVQALEKAMTEAKNPEQANKIRDVKAKLDHAVAMSQRKSALAQFADFIQFWRGPRGPRFPRF